MREAEKHLILIAAGGTGGHLFPAEALAEVLTARGHEVALMTDTRVESWVERFPGDVFAITAGTVTGAGLFGKIRGALKLIVGLRQAWSLIGRLKPNVIFSKGGFVSVPVVAAWLRSAKSA